MHRSLLAALALVLVVPSGARAEESATLQRKQWNGQVLGVEERAATEIDAKARAAGPAGWSSGRTEDKSERELRTYRQEMVSTGREGWELRRKYDRATRTGDEVGSSKQVERQTSLHGKNVVLTPGRSSTQVDSRDGKIALEDAEDARLSEKLYLLLPADPVAVGAKWDLDGKTLGDLFVGGRGSWRPRAGGAARAAFRRFATVDGRRCAELGFDLTVGTGTASALLHFALEEGTIVAFEMSGPIAGEASAFGVSVEAKGTRTVRYHARILERGEPAGTIEDDDGRGRGLFGGRRRDRR